LNSKARIDWGDMNNIADCAAQMLDLRRPSRHRSSPPEVRTVLRQPAVNTLRLLWKSGHREARVAVICRVMVWMRFDLAKTSVEEHNERIEAVINRVLGPCPR
jgi:hypothetical protein